MSQCGQYADVVIVSDAPYACRPPQPSSTAPVSGTPPGSAWAVFAICQPGQYALGESGGLPSALTPPNASCVYRPWKRCEFVAVEATVVDVVDQGLTTPAAECARTLNS